MKKQIPWNKGKTTKKIRKKDCLVCGDEFLQPKNVGPSAWKKRLVCSMKCAGILRSKRLKSGEIKKIIPSNAWKKGNKPWNKNISNVEVQCLGCGNSFTKCKSEKKQHCSTDCYHFTRLGANNNLWLGENVSYRGIHKWVELRKGKPDSCEMCKSKGLRGREIHWANKDHKYSRNLEDWMRLCRSCHWKYDMTNLRKDEFAKHI